VSATQQDVLDLMFEILNSDDFKDAMLWATMTEHPFAYVNWDEEIPMRICPHCGFNTSISHVTHIAMGVRTYSCYEGDVDYVQPTFIPVAASDSERPVDASTSPAIQS
jgi:hypothetical protein